MSDNLNHHLYSFLLRVQILEAGRNLKNNSQMFPVSNVSFHLNKQRFFAGIYENLFAENVVFTAPIQLRLPSLEKDLNIIPAVIKCQQLLLVC